MKFTNIIMGIIATTMLAFTQTAKVQVIHNSALPAAAEVDVYINGEKPDALDNFAFRSATPFVELPSNQEIIVTVASPKSTDVNDGVIATFNLGSLETDMEYVVFANGIIGDGFANPDESRDINFNLFPLAGKLNADDMNSVAVNVFHGVTDAPAVDVFADINTNPLISDLDYANSTGYINLPADMYKLTVTAAGNKDIVAGEFDADISALGGGSAVVFASGFLSPNAQSTEIPTDYSFGLYAALTDGTVINLPNITSASVDIQNSNNNILLFPIPAVNHINLSSNQEIINKVELYDNLGMKIDNYTNIDAYNVFIKTHTLPSGNYYLKIHSEGKLITKKFMINR